MRTWYTIKAQADAEEIEVSIYDEIGGWGVSAKEFIDAVKPYRRKPMTLAINSPGGDVFAGIAIFNALRAHGADVTVRVMGVAASAASIVAMAGTRIVMPENTFMMIHNPWSFAVGDAEEMRSMADMLDKVGSSLVATYVARTGKPEDEVKALVDAETWFTAAEAVENGFADEVEDILPVSAKFELDRLPERVRAAFKPVEPTEPAQPPKPPAATFVDTIRAQAEAAGLGEFADVWALDGSIDSDETLQPRLNEAREVVSVCALVRKPDLAAGFIRANVGMAAVRAKLAEIRAAADEETAVDTAPAGKPAKPAPKVQFTYEDAYKHLNPKLKG